MEGYAAVILAGGSGRRLGGADKPALRIGGQPLLDRVLAAVADATPRIVVGPPRDLPPGVLTTQEQPPGGGPVAALAAGLALVPDGVHQVALLAADLPFVTADAVAALRTAVGAATPARATTAAGSDAAVYVDDAGRRQFLCAVWRPAPLRQRLAALDPPAGTPLRHLYAGARITELSTHHHPPPWYDTDTEPDLHRAEAWLAHPGASVHLGGQVGAPNPANRTPVPPSGPPSAGDGTPGRPGGGGGVGQGEDSRA